MEQTVNNPWWEEKQKAIAVFGGYPNLLMVYHTWLTTGLDSRTGPAQTRYTFEELGAFMNGTDLEVYATHQLARVIDAQTAQMKTWMEAIYDQIQHFRWEQHDDD